MPALHLVPSSFRLKDANRKRPNALLPLLYDSNIEGILLQQSCFLGNSQVFSNVVPTFVQQCRRCSSYKIVRNHGPNLICYLPKKVMMYVRIGSYHVLAILGITWLTWAIQWFQSHVYNFTIPIYDLHSLFPYEIEWFDSSLQVHDRLICGHNIYIKMAPSYTYCIWKIWLDTKDLTPQEEKY